jgi:hypothetical protein
VAIYLIQGFFFQDQLGIGLGFDDQGGGVVAVVKKVLRRFMFSGVLYRDAESAMQGWVGNITDHYGESSLTRVHLGLDKIRFCKQYDHRKDVIEYILRRSSVPDLNKGSWEGQWVGNYSGQAVGEGTVKCILTEVNSKFFDPAE